MINNSRYLMEDKEKSLTATSFVFDYRIQLLFLLLLISGFCGISYEVLYGRIIGNIAGDQFLVSSAVLLTFLLGIGIGSRLAFRLWRWLWLIEACIGLYSLLFIYGNSQVEQFIDIGAHWGGFYNIIISLLFSCVLLLIPAFLIGCSLPLFAGYLARLSRRQSFPKAYALYNIGAAITVLMIEFWLVRNIGIQDATLVIAVLNGIVSAFLWYFYADIAAKPPEAAKKLRNYPNSSIIFALILTSIASAIFQLLMLKLSESFLGPFRETFALVLSLVLIGITMGSWLVNLFKIRFDTLMLTVIIGITLLISGLEWWLYYYASQYAHHIETQFDTIIFRLFILAVMMLLPAMAFGATITSLIHKEEQLAKQSGRLLYVTAVANAAGFLVMSLFLHRWLDYGIILLIIAFLSLLALFFYLQTWRHIRVVWGILLFVISIFQFQKHWDENLLYLGHVNFHSEKSLQSERSSFSFPQKIKSYQDVISINWYGDNPFLFINGYISMPLESTAEKVVGAFSSLFSSDNEQALVLALGSGATAGTVARLFKHTDVVEINEALVDHLDLMEKYNFALHKRKDVTIVKDDAIHYSRISDKQYSMIINTVTTPLYFSSSKLYTLDFLKNIKKMLTKGGLYVTWVDLRIGDIGMDITLETLRNAFGSCAVGYIRSEYFLLLCSDDPIRLHQPELVSKDPVLYNYFLEQGIYPPWLQYNLLASNILSYNQDKEIPVNRLDRPVLEFAMAQLREEGFDNFVNTLTDRLSLSDIERVIADRRYFNPIYLYTHIKMVLGDNLFTNRWGKIISATLPDYHKNYLRANALYYRTFAQRTNNSEAWFWLIYYLLEMDNYKDCLLAAEKAIAVNYDKDYLAYNIGLCHIGLSQYTKARELFLQELKRNPTDKDIVLNIADSWLKEGQLQLALVFLNEYFKDTDNTKALRMRGDVYKQLHKLKLALQDYRKLIRLMPENDEILARYVQMKIELENYSIRQ